MGFGSAALGQPLPGENRGPTTSRELDLRAYQAQLEKYSQELSRIGKQPVEVSKLRTSLPPEWSVRTPAGSIQVSTDWLAGELARLQGNPANANSLIRDIRLRLAAMRAQAAELDRMPTDASATARARLDKIFQGREFSGLRGPTELQRLMDRIARWIAEKIAALFDSLHLRTPISDLIVWIVIAAAFIFLCYGVWRYLSSLTRASQLQLEGHFVPGESRLWVRDALAAADRGDYREAIHCAYWAAIARLEALQLLAKDRARTPRESLRLLGTHPDEQRLLRDLTSHFELIWYGYRPASEADWSGARAQLEKMGCLTPSIPATASS